MENRGQSDIFLLRMLALKVNMEMGALPFSRESSPPKVWPVLVFMALLWHPPEVLQTECDVRLPQGPLKPPFLRSCPAFAMCALS